MIYEVAGDILCMQEPGYGERGGRVAEEPALAARAEPLPGG
jgi:hypothetical protein